MHGFVRLEGATNRVMSRLGIRTVQTHDWSDPRNFLPFAETIAAASDAGLTVADYVDVAHNAGGATQEAVDQMAALGLFSSPIDVAVEIGPGSGRYLEKVLAHCSPTRYEIYETADSWASYLEERYGAVRQETDGSTLSHTATSSADLVQAHKVFVVTPFVTTCRYWQEMIRVARPDARIVFDIVTERCMDPDTLEQWIELGISNGNYPAIVPRRYAVEFFESLGVGLVGTFFTPMRPGRTEVFVFRKDSARGNG